MKSATFGTLERTKKSDVERAKMCASHNWLPELLKACQALKEEMDHSLKTFDLIRSLLRTHYVKCLPSEKLD